MLDVVRSLWSESLELDYEKSRLDWETMENELLALNEHCFDISLYM